MSVLISINVSVDASFSTVDFCIVGMHPFSTVDFCIVGMHLSIQ